MHIFARTFERGLHLSVSRVSGFGDDSNYWNYRLKDRVDILFALLSTSLTVTTHKLCPLPTGY